MMIDNNEMDLRVAIAFPQLATVLDGVPYLGGYPIQPVTSKQFRPTLDMNIVHLVIMELDDDQMLGYVQYLTEPHHCNKPSFMGYTLIAEADAWHCTKAILQMLGAWEEDVGMKAVKRT